MIENYVLHKSIQILSKLGDNNMKKKDYRIIYRFLGKVHVLAIGGGGG